MRPLGLTAGLAGKRVVVQGLGNVGYHVAKFCQEGGAVLVGLAEYEGAIANPDGLDLEAVVAHRRATRSILDFPGATNLPRSLDALALDCDVLIPAALENQITDANAGDIRAKIVLEGANGPTTPEGEEILNAKGVMVVPDIYANAGGVTVSYFEWLKNLQHVRFGRMENRYREASQFRMFAAIERATGKSFTEEDRRSVVKGADELTLVNSGLEETMIGAYREIREARARNTGLADLRSAAFFVAIEKVGRSYSELGIFP
jgi:glutamate dehydrogenase (NAD(P)+)